MEGKTRTDLRGVINEVDGGSNNRSQVPVVRLLKINFELKDLCIVLYIVSIVGEKASDVSRCRSFMGHILFFTIFIVNMFF